VRKMRKKMGSCVRCSAACSAASAAGGGAALVGAVCGLLLHHALEGGADQPDGDAEEPGGDEADEPRHHAARQRVVAERRLARQVEQRDPHRVGDGLVVGGHLGVEGVALGEVERGGEGEPHEERADARRGQHVPRVAHVAHHHAQRAVVAPPRVRRLEACLALREDRLEGVADDTGGDGEEGDGEEGDERGEHLAPRRVLAGEGELAEEVEETEEERRGDRLEEVVARRGVERRGGAPRVRAVDDPPAVDGAVFGVHIVARGAVDHLWVAPLGQVVEGGADEPDRHADEAGGAHHAGAA